MKSFVDGARGNFNPFLENDQWLNDVQAKYPTIGDTLCGGPDWKKDPSQLPPLSITIFAQDGRLRFRASSRDLPRTFWGSIKDPKDLLGSIEAALAAAEGEWSASSSNGSGQNGRK